MFQLIEYSLQEKEIIETLNKKLKTLKTYEEFETFLKEMDTYELGFCLYSWTMLRTKFI
jgi:hypothetical protein